MKYNFPLIKNLDQIRLAIDGREEFIIADKGDYFVCNYLVNFEDTFPLVATEKDAIKRECRGLIFSKDGRLISRPFHKFFNYGERLETQSNYVDFTQNHVILEKLDGSMVRGFMVNGDLKWGTKMGETDVSVPVSHYAGSQENYLKFTKNLCENGYTPIFEWCSRKQRIVVDYPEEKLILTGIRENLTGGYIQYDIMCQMAEPYRIPVVRKFDLSLDDAMNSLDELVDAEGYVVRFDDGHMIKVKGPWYVKLHKTMEHIQQEKDLIALILDDKLDDAKPFLPPDLAAKLDEFSGEMFQEMYDYAETLAWQCIEDFVATLNKKDYAFLIKDKPETSIRFKVYDFIETGTGSRLDTVRYAYDLIKEKVRKSCTSSTKVDSVRHLFGGIKWTT